VPQRATVLAGVLALIVLALTILAGEGIHELHYADAHPGGYGPAKVIALACGAGAVLALATGITVLTFTPLSGAQLWMLLLLIAGAVALGVWLVMLTTGSSSASGNGFGGNGFGGSGIP
jgi:hypothetical protein